MEKFLIKYEKVMPGQSSVDFWLKHPNLETLTFDQILSFLDDSLSTLDHMININSKYLCLPKIMKFDYMLTTIDVLSNTTNFQPSEHLTEQT